MHNENDHTCNDHAGHSQQPRSINADDRRRLWWVLLLTGIYLIIEVIGGILTNSVALLSDAGHMLTDVASLALALLATWFATREATAEKSYGYYRLEIIAALLNGVTLLAISGGIIYASISRIKEPPEVQGMGMLLVAIGGLMVNILGAWWLHQSHKHSLNVRAAFYHILGDLLGSVGAVIAGILIIAFKLYLADPILAIVIAVLITISAISIVREAVNILLEATPAHISLPEVRDALFEMPMVEQVHDLHVWTITSGLYALSCHVTVASAAFTIENLEQIRQLIKERFGIEHQTIQLETPEMVHCERGNDCWEQDCTTPNGNI